MRRRGQIPLWTAVLLASIVLVALIVWTLHSMSDQTPDGREKIVFWGPPNITGDLGDDIYAVVNDFEQHNLDPKTGKPKYQVVLGTATSPDITGDAQRLLCAIAGDVPPDLVWFDRFAIGEWAGRDAMTDLTPYLDSQPKTDPDRIDLNDYYKWAVDESVYRTPGSNEKPGIFGIPTRVDLRILFSNPNLLRQEGFVDPKTGEPKPPTTWEELRRYANALTRYKRPGDPTSGITRLGFAPNGGNSWLYMYAWQAGGEMMNPDRTRVTMDSTPIVRALKYMVDVYDDLGGFPRVDAFQQSFQGGDLDPFLKGTLAMKIDGVWAMSAIADWKRDMDFLTSPAPMPVDRLAQGHHPITWGGGFAYVIPKTAHNKSGAWKLIQYLSSHDVVMRLEQGKREQKESEGRLYMPSGLANRKFFEELLDKYVDHNPKMPPSFRKAFAVYKEMMPHTLYRPVTPVGQLLWVQHVTAYESAVGHVNRDKAAAAHMDEIEYCLADAQKPVQRMLDEVLKPLPSESQVNWTPYFLTYALVIVIPFIALFITYRKRKTLYSYKAREVGAALMFASPWMLGFIVFVGGPILFSIVFAFTRYDVLSPAHYTGADNFRQLLTDPLFTKSLFNTVFMLIRVPLTMAASLAIAMLLNHAIRGIGFYRTACYMPAIVPMVASAMLWWWILNPSGGILNQCLSWLFETRLLAPFHLTPPLWLQDVHWSKPSLILMSLWAAGGGIIIWLAGLQSIPEQLYEAASIDGAGPVKRLFNITLPMLSPYIFFNFIIGIIATMQIFSEAFIMTHGGTPFDSTLFYAYHLFRQAFQFFRLGYASALAWILFLIVLALTLIQLYLSKKWVHYERT